MAARRPEDGGELSTPAPLRVLAVATKPSWPPIGGGSVALHALLSALAGAGCEVMLVAPGSADTTATAPGYRLRQVPVTPKSWLAVAPRFVSGLPAAIARFRLSGLADAVRQEIDSFAPDVVHVEQLHLAWLIPTLVASLPVVLRQQNVESLLLRRVAPLRSPPVAWLLRREAVRVERFEATACRAAHTVAAISSADAAHLRELAPTARVVTLPVPFPDRSASARVRLVGDPPLVAIGSFDWLPNRDGIAWFVREAWPEVRRLLPDAVLHLAGPGSTTLLPADSPAVVAHGVVASADELHDPCGIALVPLRAGSGVRLRILEAWAAGLPVVTTPVGGEGLVADDGDGAALAATPATFAAAVANLATREDARARLVARGRSRLVEHEPGRVAAQARDLYREAIAVAAQHTV